MDQTEKYRQKAVECFEAAHAVSDEHKAAMVEIAVGWVDLADLAERNRRLRNRRFGPGEAMTGHRIGENPANG
jgi:hypothetical protein